MVLTIEVLGIVVNKLLVVVTLLIFEPTCCYMVSVKSLFSKRLQKLWQQHVDTEWQP